MRLKSDYKKEAAESQIADAWDLSKKDITRRTTSIDFAYQELETNALSACDIVSELKPKALDEHVGPVFLSDPKSYGIVIFYPQSESPKFKDFILDESKLNEWKRFFKIPKSIKEKDENKIGLPVPENIESLLLDLLSDTGEKLLHVFSELLPNIRGRMKIEEVVTKLGDLQIIFGLAKKPYPINSLNYEVYDEIQNKLIELIVAVQKKDKSEANKLSSDLTETLETIVRTNKDLGISNKPLVTLHDTGKTVGGLRIFTPNEI